MGYWSQSEDGVSFSGTGDLLWGDAPADIIDDALDRIYKTFKEDVGRYPTKLEIAAGFKFSLATRE